MLKQQKEPTSDQSARVSLGWCEINNRAWQNRGDGVHVRGLAPGQRVPKDTHVLTPHPHRGDGWRLCWVFLDALVGVVVGLIVWGAM